VYYFLKYLISELNFWDSDSVQHWYHLVLYNNRIYARFIF